MGETNTFVGMAIAVGCSLFAFLVGCMIAWILHTRNKRYQNISLEERLTFGDSMFRDGDRLTENRAKPQSEIQLSDLRSSNDRATAQAHTQNIRSLTGINHEDSDQEIQCAVEAHRARFVPALGPLPEESESDPRRSSVATSTVQRVENPFSDVQSIHPGVEDLTIKPSSGVKSPVVIGNNAVVESAEESSALASGTLRESVQEGSELVDGLMQQGPVESTERSAPEDVLTE